MPDAPDPALDAVLAARDRLTAAEEQLQVSVTAARHAGRTWQQIGDVLGVSRQAAFQRFGQIPDPETGKPMSPARTADVVGLTEETFRRLAAGDYPWVRERMSFACSRALPRRRVMGVWKDVVADVGELEGFAQQQVRGTDGRTVLSRGRTGESGLPAVGRVRLRHEAGETVGHVALNRSGRITGILIGPPAAEESWPF